MYVVAIQIGALACGLPTSLGRDALFLELSKTKETHVGVLQDLNLGGVVPSMLDFSNVSTLEHELAETALSNTTSNGLGKSAVKQHAVPDGFLAFGATAEVKLGGKNLWVDSDTHGGKLKGHAKERVPDKEVAVQSMASVGADRQPVIIVGGTTVVTEFAVGLVSTNSHEEDGAMFLADNVFALLGGGIGVLLDQFVGIAKDNILRKARLDVVLGTDDLVSVVNGLVDVLDRVLEGFDIAIRRRDDLFPVPPVDVPVVLSKEKDAVQLERQCLEFC